MGTFKARFFGRFAAAARMLLANIFLVFAFSSFVELSVVIIRQPTAAVSSIAFFMICGLLAQLGKIEKLKLFIPLLKVEAYIKKVQDTISEAENTLARYVRFSSVVEVAAIVQMGVALDGMEIWEKRPLIANLRDRLTQSRLSEDEKDAIIRPFLIAVVERLRQSFVCTELDPLLEGAFSRVKEKGVEEDVQNFYPFFRSVKRHIKQINELDISSYAERLLDSPYASYFMEEERIRVKEEAIRLDNIVNECVKMGNISLEAEKYIRSKDERFREANERQRMRKTSG